LKTEFIRAILAALRLASAFVGQFFKKNQKIKSLKNKIKQTNHPTKETGGIRVHYSKRKNPPKKKEILYLYTYIKITHDILFETPPISLSLSLLIIYF
jgi:hypothetical protein